jgi:hypothetical protein
MKYLITIIIFLNSIPGGAQRLGINPFIEEIYREDSIDFSYLNLSPLKSLTDTIPFATNDENSGWRDMKFVRFFYDSSYCLKKVIFRNGRVGYYNFYFTDSTVKKVRVREYSLSKNDLYEFTSEESSLTLPELAEKLIQQPANRNRLILLKMGKEYFEKFKELLNKRA